MNPEIISVPQIPAPLHRTFNSVETYSFTLRGCKTVCSHEQNALPVKWARLEVGDRVLFMASYKLSRLSSLMSTDLISGSLQGYRLPDLSHETTVSQNAFMNNERIIIGISFDRYFVAQEETMGEGCIDVDGVGILRPNKDQKFQVLKGDQKIQRMKDGVLQQEYKHTIVVATITYSGSGDATHAHENAVHFPRDIDPFQNKNIALLFHNLILYLFMSQDGSDLINKYGITYIFDLFWCAYIATRERTLKLPQNITLENLGEVIETGRANSSIPCFFNKFTDELGGIRDAYLLVFIFYSNMSNSCIRIPSIATSKDIKEGDVTATNEDSKN